MAVLIPSLFILSWRQLLSIYCFGYRYASDSSGDTKEFYVDLSSPGEVDKRLRALQRRLQEEEDSITAASMEDFTRGN